MTVENMEQYYDDMAFADWEHKISKTPMLKAQHPGYETFTTGIHAQRGVSCADCHMPYKSEGGQKFTDHHIQSPLNNMQNACQVCHREEENKLVQNVYERQQKATQTRLKLEQLLVKAHIEAGKCWELGATKTQMAPILQDIRHAQWRWDYGAASHGASFHSPVEIGRVLASGLVIVQEARVKLTRMLATLDYNQEVIMPDISTKEKAQYYIGLDMEKLRTEKTAFKKTLLPKWLEEAEKREATYTNTKTGAMKTTTDTSR